MAWEIAFETFLAGLEATRGTAVAPTHLLNVEGTIDPIDVRFRPREARGNRAAHHRVKTTKKGTTWDLKGQADVNELPFWLNMGMAVVTSPSTPASGLLTRLWAFVRAMTTDTEKSATFIWGDPNVQALQTDYNMMTEFTLENDATKDDGVLMFGAKGEGGAFSPVADPTVPASIGGDIMPGALMQVWIDSASAIGTTAVTGRVLSSKLTVPTGRTFKTTAGGPTATLDFTDTGIQQSSPMLELTMEVPDLTQYNLWVNETSLKVRVRHNGSAIETVAGPLTYYNYVEHDIYGPFEALEWGDNQGSNRTITLVIQGLYDATLASDLRIAVENARTSL